MEQQNDTVHHDPFGPCADLPASFVVSWYLALWSIHGDAEIDKGASSIESCPISCNRISLKNRELCKYQWYGAQGRYAEAEPLYKRALAIREKALGPTIPTCFTAPWDSPGWSVPGGGSTTPSGGSTAPSPSPTGPASAPVTASASTTFAPPWRGRTAAVARRWPTCASAALADEQRGHVSGGALERAASFADYAEGYEQMVAWQAELGDVGEAVGAIERSRGRSLLDEIHMAGADIGAGQSAAEREQLRRQEPR